MDVIVYSNPFSVTYLNAVQTIQNTRYSRFGAIFSKTFITHLTDLFQNFISK